MEELESNLWIWWDWFE